MPETMIKEKTYHIYGDNTSKVWSFESVSEYFVVTQGSYAMCIRPLIGDPAKCEYYTFNRGDYVQINQTNSGFEIRKSELNSGYKKGGAAMMCVKGLELKVCKTPAGFCIGTTDEDGLPNCQLSQNFFDTKEKAQKALDDNSFMPTMSDANRFCSGGRACAILHRKIEIGYIEDGKYFNCDDDEGDGSHYYKNEKAFLEKEGICYIGEMAFDDEPYLTKVEAQQKGYTYTGLLSLVGGNDASCAWLFYNFLKWADPNSDLMEFEANGYHMCAKCFSIFDIEESQNCPSCGTSSEIEK